MPNEHDLPNPFFLVLTLIFKGKFIHESEDIDLIFLKELSDLQ